MGTFFCGGGYWMSQAYYQYGASKQNSIWHFICFIPLYCYLVFRIFFAPTTPSSEYNYYGRLRYMDSPNIPFIYAVIEVAVWTISQLLNIIDMFEWFIKKNKKVYRTGATICYLHENEISLELPSYTIADKTGLQLYINSVIKMENIGTPTNETPHSVQSVVSDA